MALDVGEKRIGVALASAVARLASPYATLENTTGVWEEIESIISREAVDTVVVGLPRNLSGQETQQTHYARNFANKLAGVCDANIVLQDEALTSKQAERELRDRGGDYKKSDIDALAATYILEDYLGTIEAMRNRT